LGEGGGRSRPDEGTGGADQLLFGFSKQHLAKNRRIGYNLLSMAKSIISCASSVVLPRISPRAARIFAARAHNKDFLPWAVGATH
jgi:hypothetical protein